MWEGTEEPPGRFTRRTQCISNMSFRRNMIWEGKCTQSKGTYKLEAAIVRSHVEDNITAMNERISHSPRWAAFWVTMSEVRGGEEHEAAQSSLVKGMDY